MSRFRTWLAIGAVAAVLAGATVVEAVPGTSVLPDRDVSVLPLPLPLPHHDSGGRASSSQLEAWVGTILGRPLFAPNRRPLSVVSSQAAPPQGLPRLAGLMRSGDTAVVIFEPAHGGKPLVLSQGGEIAGWTITSVGDSSVSLAKDGEVRTLRPSFGNAAAGPAAIFLRPILRTKRIDPFLAW